MSEMPSCVYSDQGLVSEKTIRCNPLHLLVSKMADITGKFCLLLLAFYNLAGARYLRSKNITGRTIVKTFVLLILNEQKR